MTLFRPAKSINPKHIVLTRPKGRCIAWAINDSQPHSRRPLASGGPLCETAATVTRNLPCCVVVGLIIWLSLGLREAQCQSSPQERVEIDARAQTTPLPHFWEQMFGSGR